MPLGSHKRAGRRALILEAARRLLAREGFAALTMRQLSRESGVTVPTLYNTFGSKDQVLSEAIEELVAVQLSAAADGSQATGLQLIVRILEMPLGIMESMPAYSRAVLQYLEQSHSPSARLVVEAVFRDLSRGLRELQAEGLLDPRISTEPLATALSATIAGAVEGWEVGWLSLDACRRTMMLSTALTLRSVARGELAEDLDALLDGLSLPGRTWLSFLGENTFAAK